MKVLRDKTSTSTTKQSNENNFHLNSARQAFDVPLPIINNHSDHRLESLSAKLLIDKAWAVD